MKNPHFRSFARPLALLLLLSPSSAWAASPSLPEVATTAALSRARLFPEGLAPVGGEPTATENAALAAALREFTATRRWSALDAFIQAQPQSPWLPSLLLNRGLKRFEEGFFSAALADWTRAWTLGRGARSTSPEGDALVTRALAEAVKMHCRVGRVEAAKGLLAEFGDRPAFGLNASMLDQSRKAIGQMETFPADSFKCGPYALASILQHQRAHTRQTYASLTSYPTTAQGTSLAQVAELASGSLGMKMQPVRRLSAQAPLPLPTVVHWKLDHYGALLEYKDGRYLLLDPTFGTSQWIKAEALAEDASGYFLVPAGPLPAGFAAVGTAEAGQVWGRGNCANGDGNGTKKKDPKVPKCPPKGKGVGMADWSIHHALASLNIEDIPLGYQPPVGPEVAFRINYSQLELNQPTTINYSNVGPLWNFNWVSSLTFDSNNAFARMGEGGSELFTRFNAGTGTYDPEQSSGALLVRVSPTLYERRDSDGSKLVFGLPDGSGRIFLTQQVDAQGNALTFAYDANFRLVTLTDAVGQITTLEHGSNTPGDPLFYRVTKVTDPFGRFTSLAYNASQQLTSITDTIGIVSQFTYDAGGKVNSLITPYGTTSFAIGSSNIAPQGVVAFVEVTEPNGAKQRVETVQTSTVPTTETVVPAGMPTNNQYMQWRNSFYWDRKAMAEAPGDYTRAEISHFLHLNISAIKANVLESTKSPLENRVWFAYQGQGDPIFTTEGMSSEPSYIGRVLDDGSTQLYRYTYNAQGNVTQVIDPLGRTSKYAYAANGVDLLTVKQVNAQGGDELLATYTWNAQHRPLTVTDATGATTTLTYNARGQVLTATNARGETNTFLYSALGHLNSVDGPLPGTSDQTSFTYDAVGRVRSMTSGDGYAITVDYDALDRVTRVTYPDGTYEESTFTQLDVTQLRDRLGRLTSLAYDSVRQPLTVTDPLNRVTTMEWCACGSLQRLVDGLGRSISYEQDSAGRTTAKIYPDGTREIYRYELTTSRLASVTDPRNQTKGFFYHLDDRLSDIVYGQAPGEPATAAVSFTYDAVYGRPTSMRDGTGLTTYTYGPATGGVASSTHRLVEAYSTWTKARTTFSYDELGRLLSTAVDGVSQTVQRDAIGRVTTLQNPLGSFAFSYENASGRITRVDFPTGQVMTAAYYGNVGERRLQRITNLAPGAAPLSRFDYTYDAGGRLSTWQEMAGAAAATTQTFTYDAASQLTGVSAPGRSFAFTYDKAANRLTRTLNGVTRAFNYDALNKLQSSSPALPASEDKTYAWDAENRLVLINYTGTARSTRFVYDGNGECVGVSEHDGATVLSERRLVWDGPRPVEERDAAGNVLRRFLPQGEMSGATKYFYALDHLGSVREMTDASGALRARYEYDPFGQRTRVAGDLEATRGFTGHFFHAPSGLHLTRNRFYDASTGRWLSRDPLQEDAGLNLYAYVGNNPVNAVDPFGLYEEPGIDYVGTGVALAGIVGNGVALAGGATLVSAGIALGAGTAGVGLPVAGAIIAGGAAVGGNGLYGLKQSAANLGAALAGGQAVSKGSAVTDAAEYFAPGNTGVALAANGADLALGVAMGPFGAGAGFIGAAARTDAALGAAGILTTGVNAAGEVAAGLQVPAGPAGGSSSASGGKRGGGSKAAGSKANGSKGKGGAKGGKGGKGSPKGGGGGKDKNCKGQ